MQRGCAVSRLGEELRQEESCSLKGTADGALGISELGNA